jgi:hypothetical protein
LPILAVACLGGVLASLLAGFMLASWTVAGIMPGYAAPPAVARLEPRIVAPSDSWREAGYDRIGLWEQPRADGYAEGSSRL